MPMLTYPGGGGGGGGGARGQNVDIKFHLHPFFVHVSSEVSGRLKYVYNIKTDLHAHSDHSLLPSTIKQQGRKCVLRAKPRLLTKCINT